MHHHHFLRLVSSLGLLTQGATCWETDVHNQIGHMADALISNETRQMVSAILEPEYNGSLGRAGAWADGVRKTTHKYSYGWHFISARDNPPDDCGLYYHRDCQEGGCVVQQISNQTHILEKCIEDLRSHDNPTKPAGIQCSEALKWITHFAGDVAQPMHTSERAFGGNTVKVKFNGTDTNLHQVWDKSIIYAYSGFPDGFGADSLHPYFAHLLSRIESDSFRSPRDTWRMCDMDARRGTYCPELWAKDSNAIVCDYCYGKLVNGSDLYTGADRYSDVAFHIIEEQVAKAAWRLSGWLDALTLRVMNTKASVGAKPGVLRAPAGPSSPPPVQVQVGDGQVQLEL